MRVVPSHTATTTKIVIVRLISLKDGFLLLFFFHSKIVT